MTKTSNNALRAPLDLALGDEIHALDLLVARLWQALTLIGMIGGLTVASVLNFVEGNAISALSVVGFVWFTVEHAWLGRPSGRLAVQIGTFVEGITPSAFLLAIAATRSAADALGSYVPPLLFAAVTIAAIARLRHRTTAFFGILNAVAFIALYFLFLRPRLTEEEALRPLLSPGMQLVRAMSFAGGGGLAYIITRALRRAIGRAERNVRSHDLFGKYRLEDKLGSGGMGTVHRAIYCPEGGFERTVAVKLLHPHLADKPEFISAFREEAELSARLVHPNIVQVLDFGRYGDSYFLAMEFVDGVTLSWLMKRTARAKRRLGSDEIAWLGLQILAGLAFSHDGARDAEGRRLHVIHRDLCPANILVSSSGDVRISDFGIAKALRDATFSETKTVAGHAGYMAPEQIRADPLDERCDLFAVGVILWELLSGRPLFRRGTEGLSALAILNHEVPPLSEVSAELAAQWDPILRRALAQNAASRFQTANEMSAALAAVRESPEPCHESLAKLVEWVRRERENDDAGETEIVTASTERVDGVA